jgi:hypothetical protein
MILLASLGGALDFYDFVVFGVFASAIGAAFSQRPTPRSRRCLPTGVLPLVISRGCWPWYMAAVEHTAPLIVLLVLAAVGASFASGVFGAVIADLFPTRVRYTGVALAYNVSFTAFSGTAPLLATVAISATGSAAAPALVMGSSAALALLGSLWSERHGG